MNYLSLVPFTDVFPDASTPVYRFRFFVGWRQQIQRKKSALRDLPIHFAWQISLVVDYTTFTFLHNSLVATLTTSEQTLPSGDVLKISQQNAETVS
jgi:hypothetical protein